MKYCEITEVVCLKRLMHKLWSCPRKYIIVLFTLHLVTYIHSKSDHSNKVATITYHQGNFTSDQLVYLYSLKLRVYL